MNFRSFSVKKKSGFSNFFPISPIFEIFWPIFLTICLKLGFPSPPETPDSPRVPHCRFILKMGKKSDFRCRPPKTDFRFLIYTPKNIFKEKNTIFFMYFCLSNTKIRWSKKFGGVNNLHLRNTTNNSGVNNSVE